VQHVTGLNSFPLCFFARLEFFKTWFSVTRYESHPFLLELCHTMNNLQSSILVQCITKPKFAWFHLLWDLEFSNFATTHDICVSIQIYAITMFVFFFVIYRTFQDLCLKVFNIAPFESLWHCNVSQNPNFLGFICCETWSFQILQPLTTFVWAFKFMPSLCLFFSLWYIVLSKTSKFSPCLKVVNIATFWISMTCHTLSTFQPSPFCEILWRCVVTTFSTFEVWPTCNISQMLWSSKVITSVISGFPMTNTIVEGWKIRKDA
jgi:hypothetical protein